MKKSTFVLILFTVLFIIWGLYSMVDAAEPHKGAVYPLKAISDPELEKEKQIEEDLATWEDWKKWYNGEWDKYSKFPPEKYSPTPHKGATYSTKDFPALEMGKDATDWAAWNKRWWTKSKEYEEWLANIPIPKPHIGPTYILKPYSDPVVAKEKEAEKVYTAWAEANRLNPYKWTGYIEFLAKPGTTRNIGQSDLFVPLFQDKNDLTFFNARGMFDDNSAEEFNLGLGHRHLFDKFILGIHASFDSRFEAGNYRQLTAGLEYLSQTFDFRANGYLTEADTKFGVALPTESITAFFTAEKVLSGYDGEIGYRLPLEKLPLGKFSEILNDVRVYAGGYYFLGDNTFNSIFGPRLRLEARVYDLPFLGEGSRIMLGVESQHDDSRGLQTFGLASIRIPFSSIGDILAGNKIKRKSSLTPLERRMQEPVIRDSDIIVRKITKTTNVLNLDGEEYTKLIKMDSSKTFEEVNARMQEEVAKGERPLLVYRKDSDGTKLNYGVRAQVSGGFTWAMAGTDVRVQIDNPFTGGRSWGAVKTLGEHPDLLFGHNRQSFDLQDDAHINGWNIDFDNQVLFAIENRSSGRSRISASNLRNTQDSVIAIFSSDPLSIVETIITDSLISGSSDRNGIEVRGEAATLNLYDSEVFSNGNSGIHARLGASVNLDRVNVYNNVKGGILLDGDGTTGDLNRVNVYDNFISGVSARSGAKVFVNNARIFGNLRNGVDAVDQGWADIKNSDIYDNALYGIFAVNNSEIFISNVNIYGNAGNGVYFASGSKGDLNWVNVYDNGWSGAYSTSGSLLNINNARIFRNGHGGDHAGVEADLDGLIHIQNSDVFNNIGHGLSADEGSQIFADNLRIVNNTGSGVDANGTSGSASYIKIINSLIKGPHVYGILANDNKNGRGSPHIVEAFNVDIIGAEIGVGTFGGKVTILGSRISDNEFGVVAETWADDVDIGIINIGNSVISGNYGFPAVVSINSIVNIHNTTFSDNRLGDFANNFRCVHPVAPGHKPFFGQFRTGIINVNVVPLPLTSRIDFLCDN